jgi:hypothetical protein
MTTNACPGGRELGDQRGGNEGSHHCTREKRPIMAQERTTSHILPREFSMQLVNAI